MDLVLVRAAEAASGVWGHQREYNKTGGTCRRSGFTVRTDWVVRTNQHEFVYAASPPTTSDPIERLSEWLMADDCSSVLWQALQWELSSTFTPSLLLPSAGPCAGIF